MIYIFGHFKRLLYELFFCGAQISDGAIRSKRQIAGVVNVTKLMIIDVFYTFSHLKSPFYFGLIKRKGNFKVWIFPNILTYVILPPPSF